MKRTLFAVFPLTTALLFGAASARAQTPTGNLSGQVTSSDGRTLPAVVISVRSPSCPGVRTTATSETGEYLVPLLPPGVYTVTFDLDGFQKVERVLTVAGTQNAMLDLAMSLSG